jgi:hypothetical protein
MGWRLANGVPAGFPSNASRARACVSERTVAVAIACLTLTIACLTACTAKIVPFQPSCDAGGCSQADAGAAVDAAPPDPVDTTIPVLRDPASANRPAPGTIVRVAGGVVTAVKSQGTNHGFYVQVVPGARYAGIFVFAAAAPITVAPGAVVTVTGAYKLFRELDEIDVAVSGGGYEQTGTAAVPAPLDASLAELSDPVRAAERESMLLRVRSVRVSSVLGGTDFVVTDATTSQLVVTSFVANDLGPGFAVTQGETFLQIVGVGYVTGPEGGPYTPKLAPRTSADLVR